MNPAPTAPVPSSSPAERPLAALLWSAVGQPLMSATFHNWYGTRRRLLALFGARIHPTARIRPSARITHPWNLTIGAHSTVGDAAVIECPAPVTLGEYCTVSQLTYLAGYRRSHRTPHDPAAAPITLGDDVWVAADSYVLGGVTIGARTLVGARSSVLDDLPAGAIAAGEPAKVRGQRVLHLPAGLTAS